MEKSTTIGLLLFIGGLVLLFIYGIYQGMNEILKSINLVTGALGGVTILGLIILIISIIVEQQRNKKENLSKISKEDLEP
ncbi:MAG TPA: hypothetical protein ENG62_01105 [Thermoplasmatales archaeon]|nr:hypothetical protein [Thermoplasmatales archaeon]